MPNSIAVISTSISVAKCTCAGIAVGTALGVMGEKKVLGLAGPQGADLRHSLLSDVRLVLGDHLKTSHVHPAADVETAAQEEILGSRRRVP